MPFEGETTNQHHYRATNQPDSYTTNQYDYRVRSAPANLTAAGVGHVPPDGSLHAAGGQGELFCWRHLERCRRPQLAPQLVGPEPLIARETGRLSRPQGEGVPPRPVESR